MKRISSPLETLIQKPASGDCLLETDYLIIGTGYGGAVAAMRLANSDGDGPKRDVVVLERGREYGLGDFPYDLDDAPAHIRVVRDVENARTSGYSDALFNIHIGGDHPTPPTGNTEAESSTDSGQGDASRSVSQTDVLVGSGLGGTSLINANVAERPPDHVFQKPAWPKYFRTTHKPLLNEFNKVAECLGLTKHISGTEQVFPKYAALSRLGAALDTEARPAEIAVTTGFERNHVGVKQNPCTDCGNCVTGCNVGAKNTLDRNMLPLAKSRGARFFTGATVQTIAPVGNGKKGWTVEVQATVQPVGTVQPRTYKILAQKVILAAGTLGSTEILLRSQQEQAVKFSPTLGERFSTNGDGLVLSYGQTQKVGAVAEATQKQPAKRVGPTITGIVQKEGLTIEDASIPASLARVFAELATTGAMLQRLTDRTLPHLLQQSGRDPLAASMEVADHCQGLLVMGDDGAAGKLSLSARNNRVSVSFPEVKENPALLAADRILKPLDRKPGLDGGQYVPNPLWQLMPPEASDVLGELPDGRVLSVHPLGGCAMGDSVETGVVDDQGRVFDPVTGGVHDGLYVFDGSIVPTALEVNPFFTIAALAWRHTSLLLEQAETNAAGSGLESSRLKVCADYADLGSVPERPRQLHGTTAFAIQEQLTGAVSGDMPQLAKLSDDGRERLAQASGLVVHVQARHPDALSWLDNPGSEPLQATMQMYVNPFASAEVESWRPVGVHREHLREENNFLTLQGTFRILKEDRYGKISDFVGGVRAVLTYAIRRGLGDLKFLVDGKPEQRGVCDALKKFKTFFNIGVLQSRSRRLSYEFTNEIEGVTVRGEKVLGYRFTLARLWDGLLNLDVQISQDRGRPARARLKVNTDYLLEPGLVEVQESPSLPSSLLFAGGLASYAARSLVMTNFWEFGGLEYLKDDLAPDADARRREKTKPPAQLPTASTPVTAVYHPLSVPPRHDSDDGKPIELLLTNYRRENAQPILLLHGLAQGSQIYWTPSLKKNLAAYFHDNGFDVWLLDFRISNHVLPYLQDREWSMDDIAHTDIPRAIEAVYDATGREIDIFAHCVGACTLAMAVLSTAGLSEKIHATVSNAIHPWVIASSCNRFRSKFGTFYRDWISDELLDPIPRESDDAVHRIFDRLAFSLARIREQGDDHARFGGRALVRGICDRMTFLYGRMWNHDNLTRATHEAFDVMLGPAPDRVYQQLYYFTQLRRITDKDGENVYLETQNIENRWNMDILFVHGEDSLVFNPHSAARSALRLADILAHRTSSPPNTVLSETYPEYGHMDVIIGKEAHEVCYPDYLRFLRDPDKYKPRATADDWPEPYIATPRVGPILRAAWRQDEQLYLRVWVELRTYVTHRQVGLLVDRDKAAKEFEIDACLQQFVKKAQFRLADIERSVKEEKITFTLRGEFDDALDWGGAELNYENQAWLRRLRTDPDGTQQRMCFAVGSCRYPGSVVDNALSDKVYAAMANHISGRDGVQLLFLTGDQIYADAVDQLFEVESLNTRYTDRYRTAFSSTASPSFARLVKQVPTHFALDDHELGDNWSGLPTDASDDDLKKWRYGRDTAVHFMSSGRNQVAVASASKSNSPFYYALTHPKECDFPVFVTDTRTERGFRDSNDPAVCSLISPCQFKDLVAWLRRTQADVPGAPKFIVAGSIIAPMTIDYCDESSTWGQQDGWAGYPQTLETLLMIIATEGIRKVVFVGGDAHLSALSKLEVTAGGNTIDVWQIVSSGFYAPMPFANAHREDYLWNQKHSLPVHTQKGKLEIECTNTFLSDHYSQFLQVQVSPDIINVECFDHNSNSLKRDTILLS